MHLVSRLKSVFVYFFLVFISVYFSFLVVSCKTVSRAAYFQDVSDSVSQQPVNLNLSSFKDPIIRSGDILHITIQTLETSLLGIGNGSSSMQNGTFQNTSSSTLSDYTVDKTGKIEIPVLGKFNVSGLTTAMIYDSLYLRASKYFKDPVVNVHFANFTVTILGEVARPGNYIATNEKITLLEAFALAGDLTVYAKRDNVLLLRNTADKKQAIRLDLTSSSSLISPYFFLQQGDVIFIEPNKARITAASDGAKTRYYALIASGLSVLIILISRLTF